MRKQINIHTVKEKVASLWKRVFNEDAEVEVSDGSITINGFIEIRSEFLPVERNTLRGVIKAEVDGYGVYAWTTKHAQNGNPAEDNVGDCEIGTARTFEDAMVLAITEVARDKALQLVETV